MAPLRPRIASRYRQLFQICYLQRRWLSIHEYQAQGLLADYNVPVPRGFLARSSTEVGKHIQGLGGRAVVKSQILAGGRGKGSFQNGFKGGVHVVSSAADGEEISSRMLGQNLITKQTVPQGLPVDKIYVVEQLNIDQEFYLAITTDRANACPVLIMSKGGGTGIEELAAKDPQAVVKLPLVYTEGVTENVISHVCDQLGLHGDHEKLTSLLQNLFRFFKERDATLVEINPLIREQTSGRLVCADSKVSIDNAASKRQSDIFALRDKSQEMAVELEAEKHGLVYIQLEGNIGCLVNGAGLAMATNDAVAYYGGQCANFLDGGGQATKETMVKAFELILSDKKVNTILVNIYGGIIRCDMIAESIIAAAQNFKNIPIVVRLQGTNAAKGQEMIAESGLKLFAEDEFGGAVRKAIELAGPSITSASKPTEVTKTSGAPELLKGFTGTPTTTSQQSIRLFSTTALRRLSNRISPNKLSRRTMATVAPETSYHGTTPSLAIGRDTRIIYQGFTGKAATTNAQATLAYGTNIVGGVSPRASPAGQTHLDLPVYPTVRLARDYLHPDAAAVFVPAHSAAAAIVEAIEAEIPLIVSVAEHIPLHDLLRVHAALRTQSRSRLVGPNCPGIIAPPATCRIGIMPHLQYLPGCVGIVSKSGTLSYEAVGATTRAQLGQSLCIGVGGDMLPGTSLRDGLEVLLQDEATKGIVLLGEIGGEAEMEAADLLLQWRKRPGAGDKPVVGMVTGRTAPKGRTMGHAGAVAGGGASADDKIAALERAGVEVAVHPGQIGRMMRARLEERGVVDRIVA